MKITMDLLIRFSLLISLFVISSTSAHAITLNLNGSFTLYDQQKSGILAYYDPINNVADINYNLTGVMSVNDGIGTAEFNNIDILGDTLTIHDVSFNIDPIGLVSATAFIDYGTSLNTPINFYWNIDEINPETFYFYNAAIPCSGLCGWSPIGSINTGPLDSFGFDIAVTATVVPVPPAFLLLCTGIASLFFTARKTNKKF